MEAVGHEEACVVPDAVSDQETPALAEEEEEAKVCSEDLLKAVCRVKGSWRLAAIDAVLGVLIETGLGRTFCEDFAAVGDDKAASDALAAGSAPSGSGLQKKTRPTRTMYHRQSTIPAVRQAKDKLLKEAAEAKTVQSDDLTLASARDLTQEPHLESWAVSALKLDPQRLQQLDSSKAFYSKLGHKMRCWQALHGNLLPDLGPPTRSYHSTELTATTPSGVTACVEEPTPQVRNPPAPAGPPGSRGRPLYGLAVHLEVQQKRRIRRLHLPQQRAANDDFADLPTVPPAGQAGRGPPFSARVLPSAGEATKTSSRLSNLGLPEQYPSMPTTPAASRQQQQRQTSHNARILMPSSVAGQVDERILGPVHVEPVGPDKAEDAAPGIALRRRQTFVEPHAHLTPEEVCSTAEFSYLRRCQAAVRVPRPAVWYYFGRGGGLIDASAAGLQDADVCAVVETALERAASGEPLWAMDLSQNRLTDVGLSKICALVQAQQHVCSKLSYLNLSYNSALRLRRTALLESLVVALEGIPLLSQLDLSGTPVNGHVACALAKTLRSKSSLRVLALSNCGLGEVDQADCIAVATLLSSQSGATEIQAGLEVVDFSHNSFAGLGFAAAASALHGASVKSLSFAGNSSSQTAAAGYHPMQVLIEGLLFNSALETLNLTGCRLGPAEAFMLEDALQVHPSIRTLHLSENPFGGYGLRSIVRCLLAMHSDVHHCDLRGHREASGQSRGDWVPHRWTHPGGVYHLNFTCPKDRAVMRTLLRRSQSLSQAEHHVRGPAGPLQWFKFDSKLPRPSVHWNSESKVWVVPTEGCYTIIFHPPMSELARKYWSSRMSATPPLLGEQTMASENSLSLTKGDDSVRLGVTSSPVGKVAHVTVAVEVKGRQSSNSRPHAASSSSPTHAAHEMKLEADWSEVPNLVLDARLQVPETRFSKVRAIVASMDTLEGASRVIEACSKDLSFNRNQILALCQDRHEMAPKILGAFLPSVQSKSCQFDLMLTHMDQHSFTSVLTKAQTCVWLHPGALSGSYHLDLEVPSDYAVADTILLVNSWECEVGRLMGHPDVSQQGNYEMLRNATLNKVPLKHDRDWRLPGRGVLDLDYSSIRRPGCRSSSHLASADVISEISRCLQCEDFSVDAKLKALQAVSCKLNITSAQFHQLALSLPKGPSRQSLFVVLHTSVVDRSQLLSLDVLHCPSLFSAEDRRSLLSRIGFLHLLNPLHPEGVTYTCNLLVYEERMVIELMVQLTLKEPSCKVVDVTTGSRPWAQFAAHKDDKTILPASWTDKGVPMDDAVLSCYYETGTANPQWRSTLAEKFCVGHFTH